MVELNAITGQAKTICNIRHYTHEIQLVGTVSIVGRIENLIIEVERHADLVLQRTYAVMANERFEVEAKFRMALDPTMTA